MRVKISRSIDLEELPGKISEFLEDSIIELRSVISDMEASCALLTEGDNHAVPVATQQLDGIRKKLGKVDGDLKDHMDHLVAYVNISGQLEGATVSAASNSKQDTSGGQSET